MPSIELDPKDRLLRFDEGRSSSFTKVIWTSLVVVAVFGGGFLYWYHVLQRPNYAHVYSNLGIAPLPIAVEAQPKVQTLLDQLSREPCYRAAFYGLGACPDSGARLGAGTCSASSITLRAAAAESSPLFCMPLRAAANDPKVCLSPRYCRETKCTRSSKSGRGAEGTPKSLALPQAQGERSS